MSERPISYFSSASLHAKLQNVIKCCFSVERATHPLDENKLKNWVTYLIMKVTLRMTCTINSIVSRERKLIGRRINFQPFIADSNGWAMSGKKRKIISKNNKAKKCQSSRNTIKCCHVFSAAYNSV